ncbi:hypothetical protein ABEV74_14540 [Paenibacillus cisolokensis]|uniref:hypothetical protein n=1 Tax=Paenibacillus cisolokensis TaxID=1658519 RepID=UPI003D276D1B
MAGTEKPRKFSPKPDVVVNPRATWFKRLEELMRSLEDGNAGNLGPLSIDWTHKIERITQSFETYVRIDLV